MHNCVHFLKNCLHQIYKFMLFFWKIMYDKCTKLWIFIEKLYALNVRKLKLVYEKTVYVEFTHYVYFLKLAYVECTKFFVKWIYKIL